MNSKSQNTSKNEQDEMGKLMIQNWIQQNQRKTMVVFLGDLRQLGAISDSFKMNGNFAL